MPEGQLNFLKGAGLKISPGFVRNTWLSIVLIVIAFSAILVPIIAFRYAYGMLFAAGSVIGFVILLATAAGFWLYHRRVTRSGNASVFNRAIAVGIALGLLWVIEISINNFIAPPLPLRDIIDNIFWAIIAFSILYLAIIHSYRTDRFKD